MSILTVVHLAVGPNEPLYAYCLDASWISPLPTEGADTCCIHTYLSRGRSLAASDSAQTQLRQTMFTQYALIVVLEAKRALRIDSATCIALLSRSHGPL